ncbi:hypothetical protein I587_00957 [Enterococcus mundtii ATCC 882]|nr:hypothetical protein UAC_01881 [Enterococcus mundtii ATCC 882]EOU12410.1 hypothetical protein I587_00957 [Enterococcus mundtii ATCC 882]
MTNWGFIFEHLTKNVSRMFRYIKQKTSEMIILISDVFTNLFYKLVSSSNVTWV